MLFDKSEKDLESIELTSVKRSFSDEIQKELDIKQEEYEKQEQLQKDEEVKEDYIKEREELNEERYSNPVSSLGSIAIDMASLTVVIFVGVLILNFASETSTTPEQQEVVISNATNVVDLFQTFGNFIPIFAVMAVGVLLIIMVGTFSGGDY